MLFNSLPFVFFFIIVTSLYFIIPYKYRWFLLLAGSCYFYMAFVPIYILILGFTIVIDYFAGRYLEDARGHRRKSLLIASLVANIGVLAAFKYYNFLNNNLTVLLHSLGHTNPLPYLSILLPIGLSFHTFQAMSYTIEVYRGNQKAERHFGIYALYVMFYPQLVAGPIERPQNMLHQFYEKHDFDYKRVTDGLKLMFWGLFKKMVIADRLSAVVDTVYNNPKEHTGLSFIIATIFFAFQIFCDFSGYTAIAIGAAKVMGIKLMTDFNKPYHARSISEFWKRWHISLSTWFRDYFYIPLGGNRVTIPRWYLNLFIVFLVSGLWHGANWTFIIWGVLHGFYIIFGLITKKLRGKAVKFIRLDRSPGLQNTVNVLCTFTLVTFAWIFFRAKSLQVAVYFIKQSIIALPANIHQLIKHHSIGFLKLNIYNHDLIFDAVLILLLEVVHLAQKHNQSVVDWINTKSSTFRWSTYYIMVALLILWGVHTDKQFIYFQF